MFPSRPPPPSFAFLVHPLLPAQRVVLGLRRLDLRAACGKRPDGFGRIGSVGLRGRIRGEVLGLFLGPEEILADPLRAVARMEAAARAVPGIRAVGLGSLLGLVGGRGEELARRLPIPVTTGALATAWALLGQAEARPSGGPVAVLGSSGPVGELVARRLAEAGREVRVDHPRGGRGPRIRVCAGPAEAAAGCRLVIGASTSGPVLEPEALAPGAILIDVATPGSLKGPPPPGRRVLPGEALALPPGWQRGLWGRAYHLVAGYGHRHVYACLIEPLVLAASGRDRPYALGRRLFDEDLRDFDRQARALGFRPSPEAHAAEPSR